MSTHTLLSGGQVLRPDASGFETADVLIEGGTIAAVAPSIPAPEGCDVWDLSGDLVIPGLVNAHYHSPDNLNTGRLPIAPLELWSLSSVPSRGSNPAELALAVQLGAAQMLRGGVTSVVDMVRISPTLTDEALQAIAEAYLRSGLRAAIVPVVSDLSVRDTLPLESDGESPAALGPDAREQLSMVEAFYRRWNGREGRIRVQVGPSGPQRCSDALLEGAFDLAARLGTMVHTHAVETVAQARQAHRRWGVSLVEHLARIGGLAPSTVLAHLVWPDEGDPALVARSGAVVVHNPASNLALGSGRMPLIRLLEEGARVALGTDAATCNDGLSLFESMKLATILHRPDEPDWRRWPTPSRALALATGGGAAAMGMDGTAGTVAPGQVADLAVLDARAAAFVPPNDLVRQVVMRGGAESVKHVLVGGRPLVRNRTLASLDWPAIADEATHAAARRATPPAPDERFALEIERMLRDLRATPVPSRLVP